MSEPNNTTLKRALLRIHVQSSAGDPSAIGPLAVHHADASGLGAFDASYLGAPSLGGAVNTGITDLTEIRTHTIDVTALIASDRAAGRVVSLLLLRTSTAASFNGSDDHAVLAGADSPSNPPELILTFGADVNL